MIPANKNLRLIPLVIAMAFLLEAVDTTILNTAIPSIAKSLAVISLNLKIALISYLLSLCVFIPISGWVADKYGLKRVFIIAMGIFTLSSFACGLATTLPQLVLGRILQGVGGAFIAPLGRLMVATWYPRKEIIPTTNKIIILVLIGPALGPLLGGWITTHLGWRWIFWVNVPIGLIDILAASVLLPEYRKQNVHKLDYFGFVLFGGSLSSMVFSLSALSEDSVNHHFIFAVIACSVAMFVIYIWHSRKLAHPILETSLFRFRTFRIAIAGNLATRLSFGATMFVIPLMLQIEYGYTPIRAGFVLAFMALGAITTKLFSQQIIRATGFRKALIGNCFLIATILATLSQVGHHSPTWWLCLLTYGCGVLAALNFSSVNPLTFAETEDSDHSAAASVLSTTMQFSQSCSIAIAAMILQHSQMNFSLTFQAMAVMMALSSTVFYFLKKGDGQSLY